MAMKNAPEVSWYNVDKVNPANTNTFPIAQPYDFGVVDAGYVPTPSDYYSFLIWNNRGSLLDSAPQMEDVTIGIKDMAGGNGDAVGSEVWSIKDTVKWFWAKVESLGQTDADFSMIGGNLTKAIGTTKKTIHPSTNSATAWVASTSFALGAYLKPTVDNGFIYRISQAGTTGVTQPTWSTVEGEEIIDGTIKVVTVKKENLPSANNIILGGVNDGTLANAGGNFAQVTMKIEVPLTARSGRQNMKLRTSFRYI